MERNKSDEQFFTEVAALLNPEQEPMFTLTLTEAKALYKELEKQWINHENPLAVEIVMSLSKFIDRFGSNK